MSNSNQGNPGGPEALWAAADVAKYLNVSRSWVYHRVAAGEIPCIHLGALVRFDPEAVRAYAHGRSPARGRVIPFRRPTGGDDSSK
jgi:excisionase family DNA binding protein